jgi:hypothetical protein
MSCPVVKSRTIVRTSSPDNDVKNGGNPGHVSKKFTYVKSPTEKNPIRTHSENLTNVKFTTSDNDEESTQMRTDVKQVPR